MDRAAFLDRARAKLHGPAHHNVAHPIPAFEGVPEVRYAADLSDLPTAFERACAAHKAVFRHLTHPADLAGVLDEVVATHDVRRVSLSRDPEAALVDDLVRSRPALDVVVPERGQDLADVDLGVTGAAYGIAATGTLVLDAGRAGGRSWSLVPPVHLAILRRSNLVATAADVWRKLPERFPDGPASQMVFVSGPSKSADIEFTLTIGVHGPRHVWMVLVD